MIIFAYVLVEFEVGYLRYQTSNVGFVGQTVVATIEKCRGCGHFRHVIDRWRVLKTKNKKERGILMALLRGTQREKKIGKRFRTQDKCVPRAGVISRFSFLVVLWLLQEVFLQVLRFSPLVKKKTLTLPDSNSIWNVRVGLHEFLGTLMFYVRRQIIIYH